MQKLYVQIGAEYKRLVMAPQLAAPPSVGDQVFVVPSSETFQVTSIEATGASDPLFQNLYVGTLISGPF
jgi:hypothetical protein